MTPKEIRARLACAYSVLGYDAHVRRIGAGVLKGSWAYKRFRPGMGYRCQPWLYAGTTEEVVRFLS